MLHLTHCLHDPHASLSRMHQELTAKYQTILSLIFGYFGFGQGKGQVTMSLVDSYDSHEPY